MNTLYGLPALSKDAFNGLAGQQNLPFLITGKLIDPSQLSPEHLEFIDPSQKEKYIQDNKFTALFQKAYESLVEGQRKISVAKALAESRSVVYIKDLSNFPAAEKKMLKHLISVADKVEKLYMKQIGSFKYIAEIEKMRATDPNSYKLFWRNQAPWALGAKSENDPFANALPTFPKRRVEVYPPDVDLNQAFFASIEKVKELAGPWSAVAWDDQGKLIAIPYNRFYEKDMAEIANELDQAADSIQELAHEKKLYEYLRAGAAAFRDGDWDKADEKWVAMNMSNSKYAVRIAPDETYWDPANLKAGFEVWLALIDENAAQFAKKIAPYVQEMERHIHELVPAYPERTVAFEAPDFIEEIYVSGDHRSDSGAVIGQKLPNFNDKHSRMVVMTNYYTDEVSIRFAKEKALLVMVEDIAKTYEPKKLISTTDTLLHEMTHSLGVRGSTFEVRNPDGSIKLGQDQKPISSNTALGGQNQQVMEELKAQTGGLYWVGWLKEKGIISEDMARELYTDSIMWAFGHISRGMKNGDGSPKTYSQLAAIQIRHFLRTGALTLENGKFRIHYEKMHASIRDLFKIVIAIQTLGDEPGATALRNDICEGDGLAAIKAKEIQALYDPYPRPSFELKVVGLD